GPLAAGARALGSGRLSAALQGFDPVRLGAARLLALEGSTGSLRVLAGAAGPPGVTGELAGLAASAARALERRIEVETGSVDEEPPRPAGSVEGGLEEQVLASLAR